MATKLSPLIRFTSAEDRAPTLRTAAVCGCGDCLPCRLSALIHRIDHIQRPYCGGGFTTTYPVKARLVEVKPLTIVLL